MLELLFGLMVGSACVAIPLLLWLRPSLRKILAPKQTIKHLFDELPFWGVLDDEVTLVNKNHSYARTLEIKGVDTSTITTNEYEAFVAKRHNILIDVAKQNGVLKMLTTRNIIADNDEPPKFESEVLQKIAELSLQNRITFENRHFLSLVVMPKKTDLKNWLLDRLQGKTTDLSANLARLTDVCDNITETLPHEVELLSIKNKTNHLLQFWAQVVSGSKIPPVAVQHRVDKWLSNARLDFDYAKGIITQLVEDRVRYCKIISLNEWGESSSGEILKEIISLPYEMICLQLMNGLDKPRSRGFINGETRYRHSSKAKEELAASIDLIDSDEVLMFEYQLSVFVFANNLAELDVAIGRVRQAFRSYDLVPIVETTAIKQIYLQLFPGNETTMRPTNLLSSNVAHIMNFHADEPGVLSSDWCEHPLVNFKTASGSYGFSFHRAPGKEQPANTLVVAPTGSGKTILLTYLVAMSLQVHNLRAFIFDRKAGCKIAGHAFGGHYVDLAGDTAMINIFACDDSTDNRLFITDFLLTLAGFSPDDKSTVTHKTLLRQAVNIMFSLPQEERFFSDFYDELIPKAHPLYQRLYPWGKGEFSRWISGYKMINDKRHAFDALQFGDTHLVVLEMTTILDSSELVVMCDYIMHRIMTQIKGRGIPHIIAVDEMAQMIKNKTVKKRLTSLLQEVRRSRGSVVGCIQDPNSILSKNQTDEDKELADTILNNCHTQIFFPNPRAELASYAAFKLKDREWNFILGQHRAKQRLRRPILIRKDSETEGMQSAIVDVDLSMLGKHFNLLRSGGEFVEIFNSVYKAGDLAWVAKYLEKV